MYSSRHPVVTRHKRMLVDEPGSSSVLSANLSISSLQFFYVITSHQFTYKPKVQFISFVNCWDSLVHAEIVWLILGFFDTWSNYLENFNCYNCYSCVLQILPSFAFLDTLYVLRFITFSNIFLIRI